MRTGSTVAHFLPALGHRRHEIRGVVTSPHTEELTGGLGINTEPFTSLYRLDPAIGGAD